MHFIHKWVTHGKFVGVADIGTKFTRYNQRALIELQKCSNCSKERAVVTTINGDSWIVNSMFYHDLVSDE